MTLSATAGPTSQSERIETLDILRGFAIFGILLMNIQSFAFPGVVGHNPATLNEFGTINYTIWFLIEWIFSGTQRALFSMLFGAGIILFVTRQEKKSSGLAPADYFFRRQLWLILFSVIDVYILLWNGDILFDYAVYGMMMFTFRNLPPKKLLLAAGVCVLLMTIRENRDFFEQKNMIVEGESIARIDTTTNKLTTSQVKTLEDMREFKKRHEPAGRLKRMEAEKEQVLGSYSAVREYRINKYLDNLLEYTYFSIWDVIAFMLVGMAFYKMGILTGTAPTQVYAWLCVAGLGIGLTLSWILVNFEIENHFSWFEYSRNVPFQFYELGRIFRFFGIFGFIMVAYKSNWFPAVFSIMRPVGQMAFTNYLTQSLICMILFSGFGFGLFGNLERYEVYLIVVYIWIFQLIFCNLWLRFFLYGPFEWSWRSLTYWKRQPFLRGHK